MNENWSALSLFDQGMFGMGMFADSTHALLAKEAFKYDEKEANRTTYLKSRSAWLISIIT